MTPQRTSSLALFLALALRGIPAPAADSAAEQAADFLPQARALYRIAACGGNDPLPARLPRKAIDVNCKSLAATYADFHKGWDGVAGPFVAKLRPANLPKRLVYPFGGADLLFALAAFPDATEITSIALERSGDPRVIDNLAGEAFTEGLEDARWMIAKLAGVDYSFTDHMEAMQTGEMPVQLVMALGALAAWDYEPVSLRYFRIEADGSLRYYTEAEFRKVKIKEKGTTIPKIFSNAELGFRRLGRPEDPVRIYRSMSANLADASLKIDGPLLKHLEAKGDVAAMVKAASYILWRDDFANIRDYLLKHATWMISDSTGILPMHASRAGYEQTAYGEFGGSLLGTEETKNRNMLSLWKTQPARQLPFRFGYPDRTKKGGHMIVTARKEGA